MIKRKSQTATEYLIILAVVVVIAIVAINTLGGFPGIGGNNIKKVSDYKLQTDTVGIESYSIGINSSMFKIKNNYFDTITVIEFRVNQQTNLTCNSSNTNPMLPIVLNVGQSMIVNCSAVNSSNYVITNKQTPIIGLSYTDSLGATRTAGNVNSYGNVSSGNISQPYIPSQTVLDLRQGLVAYYPLDGNTSDLSGSGYTGTNNGATYNLSGKVGGAYSFDGVNDYIRTNAYPNTQSGFTASAWFKTPVSASSDEEILSQWGAGGAGGAAWIIKPNSMVCYNSGSTYVATSTDSRDNAWHHIVGRYNGSAIKVYIDGVGYSSVSGACQKSTNYPLTIGADANNPTTPPYNVVGSIDEVMIFNRSLSDVEILQLYNSGSGLSLSLSGAQSPACSVGQTDCNGTSYLNCSSGNWVNNGNVSGQCGYAAPGNVSSLRVGLVGYWPLDDAGTTFNDSSGNSHTGSCVGTCPSIVSGKVGSARNFSSSNNAISLASPSTLPSGTITRTACTWVNPYALDTYEWAFSWGSSGSCEFVGTCGTNFCLGRWGNQLQAADANIVVGNWIHMCYTYENSTNKAYINGQLVQTLGRTWSISSGNAYIGRQSYMTSEYWKGVVDEVAVWNRTLNDTEITQLYNSGNGLSLVQ